MLFFILLLSTMLISLSDSWYPLPSAQDEEDALPCSAAHAIAAYQRSAKLALNDRHEDTLALVMILPDGMDDTIARYHKLAEHSPLPLALTTGPAHLLRVTNLALCTLLGTQEWVLHGQPLIGTMPIANTHGLLALLDHVYQTGEAVLGVAVLPLHTERDRVSWNYSIWPITDDRCHLIGLVVLIHATSVHHLEQTLIDTRASNEQLLLAGLREQNIADQLRDQLAFTMSITTSLGEGLYTLDLAGQFTMVNPAAERIMGWMEGALLGRSVYDMLYGLVAASVGSMRNDGSRVAMIRLGITTRDEDACWMHCDGRMVPIAYSTAPIVIDSQVVGTVVAFRDMTAVQQTALILAQQTIDLAHSRVELEQVLADVQALALMDELTGLYNRRGFLTLAAQQIKLAKRTKHTLSLIFIDLDDLKGINDRLGHATGSQAIADTAHILSATFRDSDIIARYGGDEFIVLVMDADVPDQHQLLQRLQNQCAQHNQRADIAYQLSLSMGVAQATAEQHVTLEDLLEQADTRMYAHKQTKRT